MDVDKVRKRVVATPSALPPISFTRVGPIPDGRSWLRLRLGIYRNGGERFCDRLVRSSRTILGGLELGLALLAQPDVAGGELHPRDNGAGCN
jgi:hypothetical protein